VSTDYAKPNPPPSNSPPVKQSLKKKVTKVFKKKEEEEEDSNQLIDIDLDMFSKDDKVSISDSDKSSENFDYTVTINWQKKILDDD
jgi:hypothetical protein